MVRRPAFATTWWGNAWIQALEGASSLDPARLSRGRTYARQGAVRELQIARGALYARVLGSQGRVYRVDIGVRTLADTEWDQVAEAIASRAAHAAALAEGELHPGVVDDMAEVDIRLLPGPGDLRPDCSCPDWAEPCKHAAAACYLIAGELDRDPMQLFLLRGIEPHELMRRVRLLRGGSRSTTGTTTAVPATGVVARDRWATHGNRELGPLPEAVRQRTTHPDPHRPGPGPGWQAKVPERFGVDPNQVNELADDAIGRAWRMIIDGDPSGLEADAATDLARRAADIADPSELIAFAVSVGRPAAELRVWAEAFRIGGGSGVAVVADPRTWDTDRERLDAGKESLVEIGHSRSSISVNYDSLYLAPDSWLVIGNDRQWYRLRGDRHGALELQTSPQRDVVDLVGPPGTFDPAPRRGRRPR